MLCFVFSQYKAIILNQINMYEEIKVTNGGCYRKGNIARAKAVLFYMDNL